MLPAHSPRSPQASSRWQARPGTPIHHHPNPHTPCHGLRLEIAHSAKPLPSPTVGQTSAHWGPRGYLHSDGSHAAPGLGRAPASLSPAAPLRPPASVLGLLLGGGAGPLQGGPDRGEGGSTQSRAIKPRSGSACPAAVRSSVYAESAGRTRGSPGERPEGGRRERAGLAGKVRGPGS